MAIELQRRGRVKFLSLKDYDWPGGLSPLFVTAFVPAVSCMRSFDRRCPIFDIRDNFRGLKRTRTFPL